MRNLIDDFTDVSPKLGRVIINNHNSFSNNLIFGRAKRPINILGYSYDNNYLSNENFIFGKGIRFNNKIKNLNSNIC